MKEHFRGVVWPRGQEGGFYKYVVAGILVTDLPILNVEERKSEAGISQSFLDGSANGMADALSYISAREPKGQLGTADMVLTSLEWL